MDSDKDLAYKDYQAGMKYKDIAVKYGVKESTIRSWSSRYWKKGVAEDSLQQNDKSAATNVATEDKTLQQNENISWLEIEQEYISATGKKSCTLEGLASKYNISFSALAKYSMANNWSSKRKKYENNMKQKVAEKTIELTGTSIAEINNRHFQASNKILDSIANADLEDKTELLNIVTTLEKVQKIQRIAAGALSPMEQHKIDYDNKKLNSAVDDLLVDEWINAISCNEE